MAVSAELAALVGHDVVIDTSGFYLAIGKLESVGAHFLKLIDCDLHDHREANSTKEVYVIEAAKYGVRRNRATVLVRLGEVVAISRLSEVVLY